MRRLLGNTIGCGTGILLAALLISAGGNALAGGGKHAWRPKRGGADFASAPGGSVDRLPDSGTDLGNGIPPGVPGDGGGYGPHAGGGPEGGDSFAPIPYPGASDLVAMDGDRAWVLSAYRGLGVIDISDPDAPRLVDSIAIDGAGQRLYVDGDRAVIVGSTWTEGTAETLVTSVQLSESDELSVLGMTRTDGSLRDAAFGAGQILLVTQDGFGNIYPLDGIPGPLAAADNANHVVGMPSWGGWPTGSVHVSRMDVGGDAAPTVLGEVEFGGNVGVTALTALDAYLVVETHSSLELPPPPHGAPAGNADGPSGYPETRPPVVVYELVVVRSDDAGVPSLDGRTILDTPYGAWAMDLDGDVLRMLVSGNLSTELRTFDIGAGDPAALGTLDLGAWPSSFVFRGDHFVYGETVYPQYELPQPPPGGPGGPNRAGPAPGDGTFVDPGTDYTPMSTLHVVDLSNPAQPRAAGGRSIGDGYLGGLWSVPDGVVGGLSSASGEGGTLFRAETSASGAPEITRTAAHSDYLWMLSAHDDLLLMSGYAAVQRDGAYTYESFLQVVDIANGGLRIAGRVDSNTWFTAMDRGGDLFGVLTQSRLRLLDVGDVDDPHFRGDLLLVVNVTAVEPLSENTAVALAVDYSGGPIELRTVALPDADALAPLDTLELASQGWSAEMFADPPFVYVLVPTGEWNQRATLKVVDASDPADLRLRGELNVGYWPTQAFLHDGALLLLRQSNMFFADVAVAGGEPGYEGAPAKRKRHNRNRKKVVRDEFGSVRSNWLRDELSAVLDVVDLANPDAPAAANRVRLRHDIGWRAHLAGDTLYIPIYRNLVRPAADGPMVEYGVQSVDVGNPLRPRARRPVGVPGTLVGATARDGVVLTADFRWENGSGVRQVGANALHVVDLAAPASDRVVASQRLPGYPIAVAVGAAHTYVVAQELPVWVLSPELDAGGGFANAAAPIWQEPATTLLTLRLSDLAVTDEHDRATPAWDARVLGERLFLQGWGLGPLLDVYDLTTPSAPAFSQTFDVYGDTTRLRVSGDRLLVPAGPAGIRVLDL